MTQNDARDFRNSPVLDSDSLSSDGIVALVYEHAERVMDAQEAAKERLTEFTEAKITARMMQDFGVKPDSITVRAEEQLLAGSLLLRATVTVSGVEFTADRKVPRDTNIEMLDGFVDDFVNQFTKSERFCIYHLAETIHHRTKTRVCPFCYRERQ